MASMVLLGLLPGGPPPGPPPGGAGPVRPDDRPDPSDGADDRAMAFSFPPRISFSPEMALVPAAAWLAVLALGVLSRQRPSAGPLGRVRNRQLGPGYR
jgi:hypothetical protein